MKPGGEVIRKVDWEVRPVDLTVAFNLVNQYHYARSGANTATFLHGLFRKADWLNCCGVAWWIPPTKACAVATVRDVPEFSWQQVISLSRTVIAPEVPKNACSFLVMAGVREIRRDGRYPVLVTFADEWQHHEGTIYRAMGWEEFGKTAPEPTFVNQRGEMVARKAGPRTRTRAEMEALGYRMIGRYSKIKFRMILRRTKCNSSTKATKLSPTFPANSTASIPSPVATS